MTRNWTDAPFFADPARDGGGRPLVPGRARWVRADDGVRLRLAIWPAEGAARGTVLLFPGRTEYVEKYGVTASALAAAGLATIAVDWRGQGLADRLLADRALGHVRRFADYQRDVAAMVAAAREAALPEPWFLIGHSMGGAIGLRSVLDGLPVRAALFTGPMWGIAMVPRERVLARAVTSLRSLPALGRQMVPGTGRETYVMAAPFEDNQLTSDPQMYAMMRAQVAAHPELALGGPTIGWLGEALHEIATLQAAPARALPVRTLVGSNERIVDVPAARARMDNWPGGSFAVVPGAEHEVLMETPARRDDAVAQACGLFFDAAG